MMERRNVPAGAQAGDLVVRRCEICDGTCMIEQAGPPSSLRPRTWRQCTWCTQGLQLVGEIREIVRVPSVREDWPGQLTVDEVLERIAKEEARRHP